MPRRWLAPEFFTDEKMKKATIPERLLAAAIIANQDDDGRLRGDPAYLRAITFLYDDYSLDEVRAMRDHLTKVNPNILVYENDGEEYIQLKQYKRYQRPRYYHPSKFPAPPGWPSEEESNQKVTEKQPSSNQVVTLGEGKGKGLDLDLDLDKGKGEGRKPHPTPTPAASSEQILETLFHCHEKGWGKLPGAKISAQLRDLSKKLFAAHCPLDYIDQAFKEAAHLNKYSVSYVRAILLDWLGVERGPP